MEVTHFYKKDSTFNQQHENICHVQGGKNKLNVTHLNKKHSSKINVDLYLLFGIFFSSESVFGWPNTVEQ
jgi:hypothetical protein